MRTRVEPAHPHTSYEQPGINVISFHGCPLFGSTLGGGGGAGSRGGATSLSQKKLGRSEVNDVSKVTGGPVSED